MPHTEQVAATSAPKVIRTRTASLAQRLLTLRQSADQYGIPERSLHDLITRGVLAFVQFPESRRIWVDRADLEAAIAAFKGKRLA